MLRHSLLFALVVMLSGCALFAKPALEEGLSIRFPEFHERPPAFVGAQDQLYELDGMALRAISIAANDFNPPKSAASECWEKQESHRYRVIRRDDILFVEISLNPSACGHGMLDGGAKYAIRADGRILRRLFDGEPDPQSADSQGLGDASDQGTLVPDSQVGSTGGGQSPGE